MTPAGPITVDTPLGPDALFVVSMSGREALGQPFTYMIDLVSDDANIKLTSLLGQTVTVHLELTPDETRHFHGYVTSADFVDTGRAGGAYQLVVRPWLWLLTNTTNCRIFQNKSTPDIVKQIFRDHGFTDFKDSLSGEYAPSEYVVQYRETDFDFVARLFEQAGIYYYFEHTASTHTLVLADSIGAHAPAPNCEKLPYFARDAHRDQHIEYVDRWNVTQNMTSGAVALRDFDFERPSASLAVRASAPKEHPAADYELYDYPGGYRVRGDGEAQARVRLEEHQEHFEQATGNTNARGLAVGYLFELIEHPRDDANREYLVTSAHFSLVGHAPESGADVGGPPFSCEFSAIDSRVPFRTTSRAVKPIVEGPQTAIVVGKSGEEIWTDNYGRVKVQFHWDREGERNEKSSCWVRVAQVWAGTNWGAIHIPRIGQEVIVDFLEGDPDRPIITGRVYNANNMPPYGLPANQTQSGIKSRSTKGGGIPNANEIRFEDRKGSEEFFVQAEKDLNSVVKNNETRQVGVDRTTTIGANETLDVGKNRKAHVGVNETIHVDADESMTVGGNETRSIIGNETVTIGGNDSKTVTGAQSLTVAGSRTQTIAMAEAIVVGAAQSITAASQAVTVGSRVTTVATSESLTIGGGLTENVGGDVTLSVGGGQTESIGQDQTVSISGGQTVTVGKTGALKVTKQLVIDAGDEVVIKAGDASITLKKNGDIILKGNNLTSDASGKLSLKSASDMTLKGSKISQN